MSGIIIAAGSICLLYFLFLAIRHVDFCIIWLVGACFLFGCGGYLRYRMLHPEGFSIPPVAMGILLVLLLAGAGSFVLTEAKVIDAMTSEAREEVDYLIVLGAQVKKTVPSKALKLRLQRAEAYLKEHPGTIAVLSGGQGSGEEITEAECMYRYLSSHGIPAGQMVKEDRSTTTRENLLFSAEVLAGLEENLDIKHVLEKKTGLVSNNFHIYRAVKLAKKAGYRKVYAIPAPSDWKYQIHYLVREYFAIVKAKIRGDI